MQVKKQKNGSSLYKKGGLFVHSSLDLQQMIQQALISVVQNLRRRFCNYEIKSHAEESACVG
jgi:hypothetical protein